MVKAGRIHFPFLFQDSPHVDLTKLKRLNHLFDWIQLLFKYSGDQCKNADIFSRKRQKLRQLVANTLFSEVDALSKGLDTLALVNPFIFFLLWSWTG